MMGVSLIEQETVIVWNRAEATANVNTYEPALIRKLDALRKIDQSVQVIRRGEGWAEYKIPKRWVKVLKPRELTDEQREKLRDRGKALATRMKEEQH